MKLEERLNHIIKEQGITKTEFARRIGVTENYIYILTGNSRSASKAKVISPMLAKVIALEFGYDPDWVLNGEPKNEGK